MDKSPGQKRLFLAVGVFRHDLRHQVQRQLERRTLAFAAGEPQIRAHGLRETLDRKSVV